MRSCTGYHRFNRCRSLGRQIGDSKGTKDPDPYDLATTAKREKLTGEYLAETGVDGGNKKFSTPFYFHLFLVKYNVVIISD